MRRSEELLPMVNPTFTVMRKTTTLRRDAQSRETFFFAVCTVTCQEQIDMVAGDFNGAAC